MYFFHQKDARIVWNERENTIYEFMVVEMGESDFEKPAVQKLRSSIGNCCSDWSSMNEFQLTLHILRLFIDTEFSHPEFRKKCLFQCGQIIELKEFRKMLRRSFDNDLFDDEFDKKYYGQELCE